MRVILRELVRRPWRFLPVGGAMTMLVVLLIILGGFLDGLQLESTGAFRSQSDRLWVLSSQAELQLSRSRVDGATAEQVAAVEGVQEAGGIVAFDTTAAVQGDDEVVDVLVLGYELAGAVVPAPPPAGSVVADVRLQESTDAQVGDVVAVGPQQQPLTIAGFAEDVTQGGATLWVGLDEWRALAEVSAPTAMLAPDVVHALVVTVDEDADPAAVAEAIDATAGTTQTVDLDTLLAGQPVVAQQTATFEGIIATTFIVVLLVIALFFALLILERVRLFAVLKAIGARSADIAKGVIGQAVIVSLGAFLLGTAISVALVTVLPADLPLQILPGRVVAILVGTIATSVLGVLLVLRRILRIEPAQAIG